MLKMALPSVLTLQFAECLSSIFLDRGAATHPRYCLHASCETTDRQHNHGGNILSLDVQLLLRSLPTSLSDQADDERRQPRYRMSPDYQLR